MATTVNGKATLVEGIGRRNAIPVIHTRGTHYEIGFDIVSINIHTYKIKYHKVF